MYMKACVAHQINKKLNRNANEAPYLIFEKIFMALRYTNNKH